MTWSVNAQGNLDIEITSSSELHKIALKDFGDTFRPEVVVLNPLHFTEQTYAERMVSNAVFAAEVAGRVALDSITLAETSFTYINKDPFETQVEVMFFNGDNSWEIQVDGASDDSATWSVDTSSDFITLNFADGSETLAIESIMTDSEDLDNDMDTTEEIYQFTGWYELDGVSGLGSFFRDQYFLN